MEVFENCFMRIMTPLQALQHERMNQQLAKATTESRKHLQEIQEGVARTHTGRTADAGFNGAHHHALGKFRKATKLT